MVNDIGICLVSSDVKAATKYSKKFDCLQNISNYTNNQTKTPHTTYIYYNNVIIYHPAC